MNFTIEDGEALIRYARANLEHTLETNEKLPAPSDLSIKYGEKLGAFVTLNRTNFSGNPLRGCIGMILPVYPLIDTVQKMSIAAAVEDPRFPPVSRSELDKLVIEISILSVPEEIKVDNPQDYMKEIVIGRDGLIVTRGKRRGLLLPQVPVEQGRNWDVLSFLENTCQKAWLPPDSWKDVKNTKIERFTATIFEESSPKGEIHQKKIGE